MKFTQGAAFQKHLEQASPSHLSNAYLVVCTHADDRKEFMDAAVAALTKKEPEAQVVHYNGQRQSVELREVLAPSLFASKLIVAIDALDQCKKPDVEMLAHAVAQPIPGVSLVLGASAKKNAEVIAELGKKELIVLDLSAEKPWDRQRRIKDGFFQYVHRQGKGIASDAWEVLADACGHESASVRSEIDKLLTYIGPKPRIELKDVTSLCLAVGESLSWRTVEKLIWDEGTLDCQVELEDSAELFPWISSMRSHLRSGLKIAVLGSQRATPEEIARALPTLKPQSLNTYISVAPKMGEAYFSHGLRLLYDLEMHLKSSTMPFPLCWDFFLHEFLSLKRRI